MRNFFLNAKCSGDNIWFTTSQVKCIRFLSVTSKGGKNYIKMIVIKKTALVNQKIYKIGGKNGWWRVFHRSEWAWAGKHKLQVWTSAMQTQLQTRKMGWLSSKDVKYAKELGEDGAPCYVCIISKVLKNKTQTLRNEAAYSWGSFAQLWRSAVSSGNTGSSCWEQESRWREAFLRPGWLGFEANGCFNRLTVGTALRQGSARGCNSISCLFLLLHVTFSK